MEQEKERPLQLFMKELLSRKTLKEQLGKELYACWEDAKLKKTQKEQLDHMVKAYYNAVENCREYFHNYFEDEGSTPEYVQSRFDEKYRGHKADFRKYMFSGLPAGKCSDAVVPELFNITQARRGTCYFTHAESDYGAFSRDVYTDAFELFYADLMDKPTFRIEMAIKRNRIECLKPVSDPEFLLDNLVNASMSFVYANSCYGYIAAYDENDPFLSYTSITETKYGDYVCNRTYMPNSDVDPYFELKQYWDGYDASQGFVAEYTNGMHVFTNELTNRAMNAVMKLYSER